MFGHDNQQHHENTLPAPDADGALVQNNSGIPAPQVRDTAGDYIDDAPMATPGITQPATTDDDVTEDMSSGVPAPAADTDNGRLLEIKQQALQQLTPLVDHLEQAPEDEFRTTMMLIQASDNQDLIPKAYEAAQKITDDKARAQAFLDVVNEINYFTHNNANVA